MNFAFYPPEINSARMYAGPGLNSLLAAAGSWDALSAELASTAASYEAVISGLDFQWRGAASEAMSASAARYMGWLQTTAEQTKQTAMQARSAAAAYEQAYAMTVPPPAVTANRTQLVSLIATNILGQNTAAIAANEAQYSDYWAQDAAAMSGYAVSSAAATQLPKFSSANKSTNESGVTAQNAAVTGANTSTVTNSPVAQLLTNTPGQSNLATTGAAANSGNNAFRVLDAIQGTGVAFAAPYNTEQFVSGIIGAENNLGILAKPLAAAAPLAAPTLRGAAGGLSGGLGNVSATLARAGSIGPMSVPASWAAPVSTHISPLEPAGFTILPGTGETVTSGYPGVPGVPAGAGAKAAGVPPRYGVRPTVMPRPPAAG
jgi:PPE-repeat protein